MAVDQFFLPTALVSDVVVGGRVEAVRVNGKGARHEVGLTSFVGREKDLAEGRRLLGGARLVTLVGPGGVGKTRLARRLADDVARAFSDGTFVVELAELRDPDALTTELATTLDLEDVTRSTEAAVTAFVRERRLLVVLDNCEHLVDACARLVQALLQASPGLRVVATSRQPLGVAGEQLMVVEPLSLPSPADVRRGALCRLRGRGAASWSGPAWSCRASSSTRRQRGAGRQAVHGARRHAAWPSSWPPPVCAC